MIKLFGDNLCWKDLDEFIELDTRNYLGELT